MFGCEFDCSAPECSEENSIMEMAVITNLIRLNVVTCVSQCHVVLMALGNMGGREFVQHKESV